MSWPGHWRLKAASYPSTARCPACARKATAKTRVLLTFLITGGGTRRSPPAIREWHDRCNSDIKAAIHKVGSPRRTPTYSYLLSVQGATGGSLGHGNYSDLIRHYCGCGLRVASALRGGVQGGGGLPRESFVFNQFTNYECANCVITEAIWLRPPATLDCLPEERLWENTC